MLLTRLLDSGNVLVPAVAEEFGRSGCTALASTDANLGLDDDTAPEALTYLDEQGRLGALASNCCSVTLNKSFWLALCVASVAISPRGD